MALGKVYITSSFNTANRTSSTKSNLKLITTCDCDYMESDGQNHFYITPTMTQLLLHSFIHS